MNQRAFAIGVVTIFAANLVAVALRSFAEASFLAAYGARSLLLLLVGQAVAFAVGTTLYDTALARVRTLGGTSRGVDVTLGALLVIAAAATAPLIDRGKPWPFIAALAVVALPSVVNLALWNMVASSVAGRDARRWLPRAGAAVTAGGALAGLGAAALIRQAGAALVPWVAAIVAMAVIGLTIAAQRSLAAGGAPGATAPPGQSASAMTRDHRALIRWLVFAAMLEAGVATALEYRFGAAMKAQFRGPDLVSAVSLFYGCTHLLLLVLQLTVVPRLLTSQRLPVTLSVHPVVTGLGALSLAVIPGFGGIAAVRTGDWVLRAATSRTGQEISLSALPPVPRARWKVLVRGVATPVGVAMAGAVLIVIGPPALASPAAFAAAIGTIVVGWIWVVRRTARRFLAALTAPLGMKAFSLPGHVPAQFDLDTWTKLVAASGSPDPIAATLARAALGRSGGAADEITPLLADENPAVRRALYQLAARRPRPNAASELRAAAGIEDDVDALMAAVHALAAHRSIDAVDAIAARKVDHDGVARSLRAARAQLGPDPAEREGAAAMLVPHDGRWAAALTAGSGPYDDAVVDALATGGESRRQAMHAATGGGEKSLAALLVALTAADQDAITAVADLDDPGARSLHRRLPTMTAAARAAIARARAAGAAPGILLAALADDADDDVRAAALRSLAGHARAGHPPAVDLAASWVDREHQVLDALTAARVAAPALHAAECDRAIRRALDRLLMAVALNTSAGDRPAGPVLAAGRRLINAPEAARRRTLDVIQELAIVPPPVLDAIERALLPTGPIVHDARARLVKIDPWLASLLDGEWSERESALVALRSCRFFATLAGRHADQLARNATRRMLSIGDIVASAGEPEHAMIAIVSGELLVDGGQKLGPGSVIGEMGLIDDTQWVSSVRTTAPTTVLVLERTEFQAALVRWPELGLALLKALAGASNVPVTAR